LAGGLAIATVVGHDTTVSATCVDGGVVLVVVVELVELVVVDDVAGALDDVVEPDDADGVLGEELHPASTSTNAANPAADNGIFSDGLLPTRRGIPFPSIRAPVNAPPMPRYVPRPRAGVET
jgi:hypothetical protein